MRDLMGGMARYLEGTPARQERAGLKKLRTARTLEAAMILTVEPGCYFIDVLLDAALADPLLRPHFDEDVLNRLQIFFYLTLYTFVTLCFPN